MFAQAPLQLDSPAGQVGEHAPSEHINPGGHAWPQNPQFATFEDKSTHSPSHKAGVCPTAHWQPPAAHRAEATHVFPQKPQLFKSDVRVVHLPRQSVWPGGQMTALHTPALQSVPGLQVAPHEPQLRLLVARSTHVLLQVAGRCPRQPHFPETH
jgi:hypothetical protein